MSSIVIGGTVFACSFGGALVGMLLRAVVPDPHLSGDSKDVVKMGTGLLATLAALVLGLLIASAKSSFDAQRNGLQQMSANFVALDRGFAKYGPEAKAARNTVRRIVEGLLARFTTDNASDSNPLGSAAIMLEGSKLYDQISELAPKSDSQRFLQAQALQLMVEQARARSLLSEQRETSIPWPFLVVVIFWLAVLFTSFGLFSPPNPVVVVTLLVCALSVGGAVFLIVDLDDPFSGLIHVSSAPLHNALSQLGH